MQQNQLQPLNTWGTVSQTQLCRLRTVTSTTDGDGTGLEGLNHFIEEHFKPYPLQLCFKGAGPMFELGQGLCIYSIHVFKSVDGVSRWERERLIVHVSLADRVWRVCYLLLELLQVYISYVFLPFSTCAVPCGTCLVPARYRSVPVWYRWHTVAFLI